MPLDIGRIRQQLPQSEVFWFDTAGSTTTEAVFLAVRECPSRTLVPEADAIQRTSDVLIGELA